MRRRWRLILGDGGDASGPGTAAAGAVNMAVDQALLEGVGDGGTPAVRFYRWSPGCLSFGRNQPARGRYDEDAARDRGIDIVRRPTGGLAVYHDRELTYAVTAPMAAIGRPRAAYAAINRGLAAGLARLGVPVRLVGDGGPGGRLGSGPCFHEGAPGEVLAEGRKLVGSAQRSQGRCILQHGSILLDGDQREVVELESTTNTTMTTNTTKNPNLLAATSLAALGHRPSLTDLVDALASGLAQELGVELEAAGLTPAERARARVLEAFYRSSDWTWRR